MCIECPRMTYAGVGSSFCTDCVPAGLPMVTHPPRDASERSRRQIVLWVTATSPRGVAAPTYYWRRNGVTVSDGGPWLGAQTGTLYINSTSMGTAGSYDAVCMNPCGYVGSSPAAVTVVCPADFDGDGVVGVWDVLEFVQAWLATDLTADADGDGFETIGDVMTFLDLWKSGCADAEGKGE